MPDGSESEAGTRTLGDYARAIWRWKWLIAGVVVVFTVAAYYSAWRQTPQYMASTVLVYQQPVDPTNPLIGTLYVDPSVAQIALENIGTMVASPGVSSRARAILAATPNSPYSVSATANLSSSGTGQSNSATISVVSTNPAEAAAVANAYAGAVIGWSRDQQLVRVKQAQAATSESLKAYKSAESRRSNDYAVLQQRRQNLQALASTVTGQFQVVVPATVPGQPFAPRPKRAAIIGFGGGLLAALALALLLEVFSPRLRGRREVTQALGLPIVGAIPEVPSQALRRNKLITLVDPDAAASEALRLLRSNIDYYNVDDVSSVLVTSCVAGEGKSTLVCNLAVTLAMAGKKIAVVDGDLRKPHVHDYFGIANDVGLTDVLAGNAKLADVLRAVDIPVPGRGNSRGNDGPRPELTVTAPRLRRLAVLTSGPSPVDPGELVASKRFGAVIADLQNSNIDLVIVDSPALLEVGDAAAQAAQVEGLLMVVDVGKVGRSTLHEARDLLAPLPCVKLGAVLVRTEPGRRGYGSYGSGS